LELGTLNSGNRPPLHGGRLRAVILVLFVIPWSTVFGILIMLSGMARLQRVAGWLLVTWARGILFVSGIRVAVTRDTPLDPARNCIFMVNHQSALDIPILFSACAQTHDVRFMAKESLFQIPVFGWGMRWSGFIPIRRDSARHSAEIFQELLASGAHARLSYVMFPEGTRSPDGRLQPLKRGAIGFAQRLARPIVPVTLCDACRANPKARWVVRAGTVRVVFHAPLPVAEGAGREERDKLTQQVAAAIRSALPEDQLPLASSPPGAGALQEE
jgi:1-acyl-sn-glycerol-3-phosphate acyltransferase